jgi:hypothetical protein
MPDSTAHGHRSVLVCHDPGVSPPMTMHDRTDDDTEYARLVRELDRLQREQQTLDLRDRAAVNDCERKIAALRKSIDRFRLSRRTE